MRRLLRTYSDYPRVFEIFLYLANIGLFGSSYLRRAPFLDTKRSRNDDFIRSNDLHLYEQRVGYLGPGISCVTWYQRVADDDDRGLFQTRGPGLFYSIFSGVGSI